MTVFSFGQSLNPAGFKIAGQSGFSEAIAAHGARISSNNEFNMALKRSHRGAPMALKPVSPMKGSRRNDASIALEAEGPFHVRAITAFSKEPLGEHLKKRALWIESSGRDEFALFGGLSESTLRALNISLNKPNVLITVSNGATIRNHGRNSYSVELHDGRPRGLSVQYGFDPSSGWRHLSRKGLTTGEAAKDLRITNIGYLHFINNVGVVSREVSEQGDWATINMGDLFGTPRSVLLVEGRMQ